MSDCEPTEPKRMKGDAESSLQRQQAFHPRQFQAAVAHVAGAHGAPAVVSFDRHELRTIFGLYGRKVAEGEWRDYAIDFLADRAVFSIFRRASEVPLYRIEKDPRLARRQGAYSVLAPAGLILKRGPDLARVIAVLDRRLKLVVS
jgi:hypothetical protein